MRILLPLCLKQLFAVKTSLKFFFSELSDDTGYRFKVAGTGWPQIIKKIFFKIENHLQKVCQLSYRQGY